MFLPHDEKHALKSGISQNLQQFLPDRELKIAKASNIINGRCHESRFTAMDPREFARIGMETIDGLYQNAVMQQIISNHACKFIFSAKEFASAIGATAPGSRIDAETRPGCNVFVLVGTELEPGFITRVYENDVDIMCSSKVSIILPKQSELFLFRHEQETLEQFPHWAEWAFPTISFIAKIKKSSH